MHAEIASDMRARVRRGLTRRHRLTRLARAVSVGWTGLTAEEGGRIGRRTQDVDGPRTSLRWAVVVPLVFAAMLLGAAPAPAQDLEITAVCTPAPSNCSGWYRENVTINWVLNPRPDEGTRVISGCDTRTLTVDTAATLLWCEAEFGSSGLRRTKTLQLDKTAPTMTGGTPSRAADVNGWYNEAVSVAFRGSDLTSGVAACTEATYAGPDSATASMTGTCTDKAGNVSSPFGYGLKYDETAPAITRAEPERAANRNGWFNAPVRFDIVATDPTSGIADCPPVTYGGPESATAAFTATCGDRAGNSSSRAFALKYDATRPAVLEGLAARAPDVGGWYNTGVSIAFRGTDELSGVETCTATTYAGPDGGAVSVPGTCTDRAGNVSAPLAFGLKYDGTNPVVTGGLPARAANADGWYNRPVEVAFQGVDQTSGIGTCIKSTYGGPDSGTASLEGTCTDKAGNVSSPFGYGLKYDATGPAVTGADPERPANAEGWFNRPVAFTIRGSDVTSGIAACPAAGYGGPDSATASVTGTCRDRAGNPSSRAFPLKYDATAPTVTRGQAARLPDLNGWYRDPVSIAFTGTDGLSGVNGCTTATFDGPDSATASATGTCTDVAGNVSGPLRYGLKYDETAPAIAGAEPERAPNGNGWFNRAVRFDLVASDPTSGIAECPSVTYGGPDSATAAFTGTCSDRAGNASSRAFAFRYDATAPTATRAQAERPADINGWYNHAVAITFSGSDETSGITACTDTSYGGPDGGEASLTGTCSDKAGNVSGPLRYGLKYDETAPAISGAEPERAPNGNGWFNRPVRFDLVAADPTSGIADCPSVAYGGPDSATAAFTGTCRDRAGNTSSRAFALKYDATLPVVTRGQAARAADAGDWYNRPVPVAFSGTDQLSGVNSCTATTYDGPDGDGVSVPGTCTDRAGNVSDSLAFGLKYDETDPEVTGVTAARPPDHAGWFVGPVRFDVSGADATSGLAECPAVTYSGPDGADAVLTAGCLDRAGNSASRAFPLKFDATPPPLADLSATAGDRSVAVSWRTTTDTRSAEVARTPGLGLAPTSVVFRGPGTSLVDRGVTNGVRYVYRVRVEDAAGNASSKSVVGVPAAPPAAVAAPAPDAGPPPAAPAPPVPVARARIGPPRGAILPAGEPLHLRWPRVQRARYYNVQVFRDGRKILSAWPSQPRYQLKMRWRFRGKMQRLAPGRYRWLVWPGRGPRSRSDYGKRIVRSTFEVRNLEDVRGPSVVSD